MNSKIYLLVCALVFISFSCKKSENGTDEGEHFNCNIDGNYWTFKKCSYCNDALIAEMEVVDRPHFSIIAGNSDDPQTEFTFSIDTADFNNMDTIDLFSEGYSYAEVYSPYLLQIGVGQSFKTINGSKGKLIFTNRTASIIQGTFEFDATNGTSIVHITNGKFLIGL